MVALAAAIQFLSISPAFIRRPFTARELGASTAFYPAVGLILGAILAGADAALSPLFPAQVRSALMLALWIAITGALHFDGLLDTCDGLFGGHTPRRRLAIMRDERTGAYALAAGALTLLIMFAALNAIEGERWAALLLAPAAGRCGITCAVVIFPYARRSGLGRDIKNQARPGHAVAALITTAATAGVLTWLLRSLFPLAGLIGAAAMWGLVSAFMMRRIPGMTGDTYGAINMMLEMTVLLVFAGMP